MEDNKIDINSLIGFFLIGLIFIGWLYLNPPPPSSEVVQTIDNDESIVEEPAEPVSYTHLTLPTSDLV